MIGCGCGEKFKTQLALNEHRRVKHAKGPFTTVTTAAPIPMALPPEPKRPPGRRNWDPDQRAAKAAAVKAQWQGQRERMLAAVQAGQRKRRERERLEKEKALAPVSLPRPPQEALPTIAFDEGAGIRQRLADAIAELVAFEVRRALGPKQFVGVVHPAWGPELLEEVVWCRGPEKPAPPPEPPPKPERTVPLPRPDWEATRSVRVHRIEPVEKPPAPLPLPKEVEVVTEREDPVNAHRNLGMRAAVAIAHRLGIRVRKNSSGEIEFAHPLYPRRLRVNVARRDAPRLLLTMLREVEKSIKLGQPTRVGPTGSV